MTHDNTSVVSRRKRERALNVIGRRETLTAERLCKERRSGKRFSSRARGPPRQSCPRSSGRFKPPPPPPPPPWASNTDRLNTLTEPTARFISVDSEVHHSHSHSRSIWSIRLKFECMDFNFNRVKEALSFFFFFRN